MSRSFTHDLKTRRLLKILPLIFAGLATSACGYQLQKTDNSVHASLPVSEVDPSQAMGCEREESSQIFSGEAQKNILSVKGIIEIEDHKHIDCKGGATISKEPNGPLQMTTSIPAPVGLAGQVEYVEILNQRTCGDETDDAGALLLATDVDIESNNGTVPTVLNHDGQITLSINNISVKLSRTTRLMSGQNAITVKYFGKCLQRRADARNLGEGAGCEKGDLLLSRDLILDLTIENREIPGLNEVNDCQRPK